MNSYFINQIINDALSKNFTRSIFYAKKGDYTHKYSLHKNTKSYKNKERNRIHELYVLERQRNPKSVDIQNITLKT